MKQLKCYDVSEEVFNYILYNYEPVIEICDLHEYIYGYKPKNKIKYNGKDTLICREYILSNWMEECTTWKQIIVRKKENATNDLEGSLSGSNAWNYMYYKVFRKEYTAEEIDNILKSHEEEKSDIYHYSPTKWMDKGIIYKLDNCEYYDINSAYCSALVELFPKCENILNNMYKARKDKPVNKKYFNFFCGMLCRKGYRKTFNWITHRTKNILMKAIEETGVYEIYANTDGFIVQNPVNKLKTSKALGDFKSEYSGTIYFYTESNYYVMQYGDEIKGSALNEIRKDIDLSKGDVVHYLTRIHPTLKYKYADNIIKENIYEKSKKNMN